MIEAVRTVSMLQVRSGPSKHHCMLLAVASLALSITVAQPSSAATPKQAAEAEATFKEALALMDNKKYVQACPLLEKSQQLDPGMGTQFQLAQCYEHTGRLASAWHNYRAVVRVAQMANMSAREQFARKKAESLEARLPRLAIRLPSKLAAIERLSVERDGVQLERSEWTSAVPVDPGPHHVTITAPGKRPWSTEVQIPLDKTPVPTDGPPKKGKTFTVEAPELDALTDDPNSGSKTQLITGVVVAGVGVAAIGAGVVVGLLARSDFKAADEYCKENLCKQPGFDARNSARTQGDVSTGVVIAGAAMATAGVIVWLTAPSSNAPDSEPASANLRLTVSPMGMNAQLTW